MAAIDTRPRVIIFTGLPGTGKSTLAEKLARLVAGQETADRFGARLYVIECICSDEAVHRTRIEGRVRGIPGWHEFGWDHVERMRAEFGRLSVDRLVVDAVKPVEDNFFEVAEYVNRKLEAI